MSGLAVILATLGVASFVMGALRTLSVLPQRAYYRDGLYFVAVRNPAEWHELREFVQPSKPEVVALYSQIGPDAWSCFDWVCRNLSYRRDIGEFWMFPSEVLSIGQGDCEDSANLLTSLLRAGGISAYTALGDYQGYGHAWCECNSQILETTFTQARAISSSQNYHPYLYFSEQEVVELWPGALREVFEIRRHEATKLNLIAAALET